MKVNDNTCIGSDNLAHRFHQLFAAITSLRAEDIAGQALRVQPDKGRPSRTHVAMDQRQMLAPVDDVAEDNRAQLSTMDRKITFGYPSYQDFTGKTVGNQVAYDAQWQRMRCGKFLQFRQPGRLTICTQNRA